MIRLKNESDFFNDVRKPGSLAVATSVDLFVVPYDCSLVAILIRNGTAGVDGTGAPTQDVRVDFMKNGTTILATNKVSWTHTALARAPSSYGDFVGSAPISFAKGDTLSMDVTQILNGTSPTQPTNLDATLVFRRKGSLPAQIATDTLIPEGE